MYGSFGTGSFYLIAAITLGEAERHPDQKVVMGKVTVAIPFRYYF